MKKLLSLVGLIFLCSCISNNGDKFTNIVEPKNDEAVVYFYRPSNFGSMIYFRVKDEINTPIRTIYRKSYFPYVTKKLGERKFTAETETESAVSLKLEAGQTYFVESGLKFGILVGRPDFKVIQNKERALEDLKKCYISNN